MKVGRVRLYLLDTNIPENANSDYRDITDQLYGGDLHTRIRQEIVLGIGGLRALAALGLEPTTYPHERGPLGVSGHRAHPPADARTTAQFRGSARSFAAQQRIHYAYARSGGFRSLRSGWCTSTSSAIATKPGIPFDTLMSLGPQAPIRSGRAFSMAICALTRRAIATPSAACIGDVSREMFQDLWPTICPPGKFRLPRSPMACTCGSWVNGDLAALYDQYLQPDWREAHYRPQDLGEHSRDSGRRIVGSAPPAQTAAGAVRARAGADVAPCTGRRRRTKCAAWAKCSSPTCSPSALRAGSPPINGPR